MTWNRTLRVVGLALVCLATVAVLAVGILEAQRAARSELEARWADRAHAGAGMLESVLSATARRSAPLFEKRYGGRVTIADLERERAGTDLAYVAVTTPRGRVLAATAGAPRASARRAAGLLGRGRGLRPARFRLVGVSNVGGGPVVEWMLPYRGSDGVRVHVAGVRVRRIDDYLGETLAFTGATRALLLDRRRRVLADSAGRPRGAGPAVWRARGDDSVAEAGVAGTPLRLVLVQPRAGVYAGFDGVGRWLPWVALALAAAAMLFGLGLLVRLAASNAALRRSEERFALAFRGARDALWDWDLGSGRVHFSERWGEMLGLRCGPADPMVGAWLERVHPDDALGLRAAIEAHLAGRTDVLDHEHRLQHADGSWLWVRVRGAAQRADDGLARRMAGSLTDISVRRQAVARLEHRANHDPLTGLANRARFFALLEEAIARAGRGETPPCAVVFLDLDGFKAINDRHGHLVGDRLLEAAARRLEDRLRPGDVAGRLGGDELAVLIERVTEPAEAEHVARRLAAALEGPFELGGVTVRVTASVGVAVAGPDEEAERLVQLADAAMYRAKSAA